MKRWVISLLTAVFFVSGSAFATEKKKDEKKGKKAKAAAMKIVAETKTVKADDKMKETKPADEPPQQMPEDMPTEDEE